MNLRSLVIYGASSVLMILVILLAYSFSTVEPTEYALSYNSLTKSINKDYIYEGGRWCIGPTKSFIKFPKTQQSIEFSENSWASSPPLRTRTKEGLALSLSVNFQYQLIKEQIPELYDLSNVLFEQTFIRIARDTILQEAGNYEAPQYWQNRTGIGLTMKLLLNKSLKDAYATCTGVQMLLIGLPDSYENSIVDTQVEVQNTNMKGFEQKSEIIRQESQVLISECNQNITVVKASADAHAYYLKEKAKATANKNILDIGGIVYHQARSILNLTDKELSEYLMLTSMQGKSDSTLIVGTSSNQLIINFA